MEQCPDIPPWFENNTDEYEELPEQTDFAYQ
jgi:hypothetical protein